MSPAFREVACRIVFPAKMTWVASVGDSEEEDSAGTIKTRQVRAVWLWLSDSDNYLCSGVSTRHVNNEGGRSTRHFFLANQKNTNEQ